MVTAIIKNSMGTFSEKERKIAEYILGNPEVIVSVTSNELAKTIGVSQSGIIKFVKKLNFKGFTEFKVQLGKDNVRSSIKGTEETIHTEVKLNDTLETIGEKIRIENIKALNDTMLAMDFEVLDKVTNLIKDSRRILLIGTGMSSLVAKDFELKLTKLGKWAIHPESKQVQLMQLSTMQSGDLLIAISHTGETEEVIEVAKKAKEKGLEVVSITSMGRNTIETLADYSLFALSDENLLRASAISSRMAQLIILDMIFIALIQKDFETANKYIKESKELVGWGQKY